MIQLHVSWFPIIRRLILFWICLIRNIGWTIIYFLLQITLCCLWYVFFAQEEYLIKAILSVLRYGLYNKAQHLLRSVYTDYSVECIRVPVRKKHGRFWVVGGILEIFNDQKGCQLSMDTTLFIYESVYALAEGTNLDHVVGKETTLLEFEDVYATDR